MTRTVLVTGGAGFIGSHIARRYAEDGHEVRILDNRQRSADVGQDNWAWLRRAHPDIDRIEGDITNFETVTEALDGVDAVAHMAGQVAVTRGLETPRPDCRANVMGTLNLLTAAEQLGTRPAVAFASTNKVYGKNVNGIPLTETPRRYEFANRDGIDESVRIDGGQHTPYGVSKLAADCYIQDYHVRNIIDGVAFRMSCIYGPRQYGIEAQGWIAHFIRAAIKGEPITIYGDGRQVRDALYIDDCVAAYRAFLDEPKDTRPVLNLGGGPDRTVSLLELVDLLAEELGERPTIRFEDWRPGDQRVYVSDISRAKTVLDWRPTVDVREGVRRQINWKTHEHAPRA